MMESVLSPTEALTGVLTRASAIFLRDAKLAISYSANFWFESLGTMFSVVVTYMIAQAVGTNSPDGAGSYFNYLTVNMAFFRFQGTALISFANAIRESQLAGTLEVMLATPTSIPLLILSAGLWAFTWTGLQTALFLITAIPLGFDVTHTNLACVLVFTLLTVACMSPLGIIAASLTMRFKKSGPIEFFFSNVSLVCSGIFLPVDRLPHLLQGVGWLLPITHTLTALRGGFRGDGIVQHLPDALWLCGATLLLLPLSLLAFSRAVRIARFDGTLGTY